MIENLHFWVALLWFSLIIFDHIHTRVTFIPPLCKRGERPSGQLQDTCDSDPLRGLSQSLSMLVRLPFLLPHYSSGCNHGNAFLLTVEIIDPVNIYCSYIKIYIFGHCLIRRGGYPYSFPGSSQATIQTSVAQWPHSFQPTTNLQALTDCPSSVTLWFLTRVASISIYKALFKHLC